MNTNTPNLDTTHVTSGVSFVEVDLTQVDQRLDNFLLKTLKTVPKTRVYRIIRKGEVRVNKKRCKPDYKLKMGDIVRVPPVRIDQTHDAQNYIAPALIENIEKTILFENKHLVIINKPSGLAVHSGSGINFGVIDIMRRLRPDTEIELAHRLDRDTSGCLLLAKHRQSLLAMQRCFLDNSLNKTYLAVAKGCWPQNKKEVTASLKKVTLANGERRVLVDPAGQSALTKIIDCQQKEQYSVLTIQLMTGRTHQIRVHCQSQGHELIGDTKYGDVDFNKTMKKKGFKRLMLHASRLELPRTEFSEEIVINADTPDIFNQLIKHSR
ncbi:MAG: 23S rRNA pseudouridine955/2504/2580 synthase [Oleispira sp.]